MSEASVSAPAPALARARWSARLGWGAFGALLAMLGGVFYGVFQIQRVASSNLDGVESFFFEPAGASPALVFVIAGWLLSRRWRRLVANFGRDARPLPGAMLAVPGALLGVWGYRSDVPELLLFSMIGMLLGLAWATGGRNALRLVLPPALFLLFAVPIPTLLLNSVMYPLQLATAKATAFLLSVVGLEAFAFGERILYDQRIFQVIESCSGVRTVHTLIMAGVLYLELFPHRRWNAIALLALTPVIGLVINLLRVITIVLNPLSDFAAVHETQGVVMIVLGVFAIALCARWIGGERRRGVRRELPPPTPRAWKLGAGLSVAAFTLVGAAALYYPDWSPKRSERPRIATLPYRHAGWQASSLKLDQEFLGSVRFSKWIHRRYTRDEDHVELMIGEDDRNHYGHGIYGLKTAVPGSGWEIRGLGEGQVGVRKVERYFAYAPGVPPRVIYRWYVGAESAPRALWRAFSGVDRVAETAPDALYIFRLSSEVSARDGHRGIERAAQRIEGFLGSFDRPFQALLGPSSG